MGREEYESSMKTKELSSGVKTRSGGGAAGGEGEELSQAAKGAIDAVVAAADFQGDQIRVLNEVAREHVRAGDQFREGL